MNSGDVTVSLPALIQKWECFFIFILHNDQSQLWCTGTFWSRIIIYEHPITIIITICSNADCSKWYVAVQLLLKHRAVFVCSDERTLELLNMYIKGYAQPFCIFSHRHGHKDMNKIVKIPKPKPVDIGRSRSPLQCLIFFFLSSFLLTLMLTNTAFFPHKTT